MESESWFLYHFFRLVSFLIDKIRNEQYVDDRGRPTNHYERYRMLMQP